MKPVIQFLFSAGLLIAAAGLFVGCGDSGDDGYRNSTSTSGAADHMSDAFANSKHKSKADAAAEAMKRKNYEKALRNINLIKSSPDVTMQEGMAVRDSLINLERDLIYAIEDGDPKAKQVYEVLKQINRN